MLRFFNLGHGTKRLPNLDYAWPYDLDLCFDQTSEPIAFSEGVCHGSAGAVVSVETALSSDWRDFFEITNSLWLLPYLETYLATGSLPKDAILKHFEEIYGRPADSYEAKHA
jgi:hypothetical protein